MPQTVTTTTFTAQEIIAALVKDLRDRRPSLKYHDVAVIKIEIDCDPHHPDTLVIKLYTNEEPRAVQ